MRAITTDVALAGTRPARGTSLDIHHVAYCRESGFQPLFSAIENFCFAHLFLRHEQPSSTHVHHHATKSSPLTTHCSPPPQETQQQAQRPSHRSTHRPQP